MRVTSASGARSRTISMPFLITSFRPSYASATTGFATAPARQPQRSRSRSAAPAASAAERISVQHHRQPLTNSTRMPCQGSASGSCSAEDPGCGRCGARPPGAGTRRASTSLPRVLIGPTAAGGVRRSRHSVAASKMTSWPRRSTLEARRRKRELVTPMSRSLASNGPDGSRSPSAADAPAAFDAAESNG